MLFQTREFLVLMLLVICGIALLRRTSLQHVMLLIASYVFYGWWDVRFLMLIVLSTVIDYAAALGMHGVKLGLRERLSISAVVLVSMALFVVPDWPSVQSSGSFQSVSHFLHPTWAGYVPALIVCSVFGIAGPMLYGLLFRLGERTRKRAFLVVSICANLGILGFFKYFGFFTESLIGLAEIAGIDVDWAPIRFALPVGISFYTFQTMSYTIDAYRGHIQPERSFVRMALYVAYFPQLVAGPILRPQQFFPSLDAPWSMRDGNIRSGFHLVAVGLFKKVLIADSVAPLVEIVLKDPQGLPSIAVLLATCLFAIQIYCDFSGYTDIARGISRMFGVEIPLNFNFPYFSTSIIEFWRRWHISLSTWLRDYLYIPLGGNRVKPHRVYVNLMITMVLGGLWHGDSWNFVIWGAYQGLLLCTNRLFASWCSRRPKLDALLRSRLGTCIRWAVTTYFWLLGWLIFYVRDTEDLLYCMKKFVLFDMKVSLGSLGLGRVDVSLALLAAFLFGGLHTWGFFVKRWPDWLDTLPRVARLAIYVLLGVIFYFGWPAAQQAFIYFQF
ncbi:MAG: MBOAT family protein [Phycisphaeraceae bacterium]|nr:MBOAT family protein [Phycisphaerales bacterium]MCB9859984.1 MBOAT family protein [Phycisphaeraceae bacterium]